MGNTCTILVADDEAHISQVVSTRLRRAGYEVVVASDGEEAFELALEHAPDLVVTDLQMPYMNGLELALKLRCHAATANTPVIMLTARGYILEDGQAEATNIRLLMSKPFSARELTEKVGEVLGEQSEGREAA